MPEGADQRITHADRDDLAAALVDSVSAFLVAGIVLALITGRLLDAMALGDDIARGLGQRVMLSRGVAALTWIVLAGGATAAAGPIAFVGLTVPHAARAITAEIIHVDGGFHAMGTQIVPVRDQVEA